MKIRLTKEQIEQLKLNPDTKVKVNDPWWVIVAKVIAYVIGLLLAGYTTPDVVATLGTSLDTLFRMV